MVLSENDFSFISKAFCELSIKIKLWFRELQINMCLEWYRRLWCIELEDISQRYLVKEKKISGPKFPSQSKEILENFESFDDSSLLIKSENDNFEENDTTSGVKATAADPIIIYISKHQFETENAVSSFSNLDSNTIDTSSSSSNVSQEKGSFLTPQDYLTFKTEIDREAELRRSIQAEIEMRCFGKIREGFKNKKHLEFFGLEKLTKIWHKTIE